jgi:hypothetical protein
MKFNWGTGIFLFLVLFLAGAAVFLVFASKQQVNLVHKNYYEKGVDHSEQMKVNERSKPFARAVNTQSTDKHFIVEIDEQLISTIDSGKILMYRPSDYTKDISVSFSADENNIKTQYALDKNDLLTGRYILKFTWHTQGVRYEIDKPVSVQ